VRWLKHLSTANEDPKISLLLDRLGPLGYGVWWLILEKVAASLQPSDTEATLTHSTVRWAGSLSVSPLKFINVAKTLHELGLVLVRFDGSRVSVSIPNLLKYRDEHTTRSGVTREKLQPRVDKSRVDKSRVERAPEKPSTSEAPTVRESQEVFAPPEPSRKTAVEITTKAKPKPDPQTDEFRRIIGAAWESHVKHRPNQTEQIVIQQLLTRFLAGDLDLEKFSARHGPYVAYWERNAWGFDALSLLDWIDHGMPAPPKERAPFKRGGDLEERLNRREV
jgi:hypothetical protein